jgi:hypothetical protein
MELRRLFGELPPFEETLARIVVASGKHGVVGARRRLVRLAEAGQVRGNYAVSCCSEYWDHLAIQVTPGWLPVEQQYRVGILWTFVQIMYPQFATLGVIHHQIMRCKVVSRQIAEVGVGSSRRFQGPTFGVVVGYVAAPIKA